MLFNFKNSVEFLDHDVSTMKSQTTQTAIKFTIK